GCSWRTDAAITIFAKLGAFLLSSKSNRAVVPSIFGFPRISSVAPSSPRESCFQAFGRAVSEMSEALLVPSARRVGVNLIIYPKSLRSNSFLEIEGQEELSP